MLLPATSGRTPYLHNSNNNNNCSNTNNNALYYPVDASSWSKPKQHYNSHCCLLQRVETPTNFQITWLPADEIPEGTASDEPAIDDEPEGAAPDDEPAIDDEPGGALLDEPGGIAPDDDEPEGGAPQHALLDEPGGIAPDDDEPESGGTAGEDEWRHGPGFD
jgi:hypothetical protein